MTSIRARYTLPSCFCGTRFSNFLRDGKGANRETDNIHKGVLPILHKSVFSVKNPILFSVIPGLKFPHAWCNFYSIHEIYRHFATPVSIFSVLLNAKIPQSRPSGQLPLDVSQDITKTIKSTVKFRFFQMPLHMLVNAWKPLS